MDPRVLTVNAAFFTDITNITDIAVLTRGAAKGIRETAS